ncbi:MAG: adenylate/guanylate cyclase domain-containing protein [Acidobacteria bacterium]|nr:adenylate/guanylate cyclase domain-containing protein [Acidobacteriota bacterium]
MKRWLIDQAKRLHRFTRKHRAGLLISATVCVISLALYVQVYLVARPSPTLSFLGTIELRTLDMRFQLRGKREHGGKVVIVAIDQKSQDVFGRWPFPRSHFATMVDVLRESGARVIAFDATFPQPDQNSALLALKEVRQHYDKVARGGARNRAFDAHLKTLETDADNDRKFAEALSRFENVILGYFFFLDEKEASSQNKERVNEFLNYLSFQAYPQIINPQYAGKFEGIKFLGLSPNLPEFSNYAKNFGYFNVLPDSDGVVRRIPATVQFKDNFYPSLDMAAYLAYMNQPLDKVGIFFNPNGLERIDFGPLSIPTDPRGFVQIDYYGEAGTFPTVSMVDVVQRKLSPERFRDCLVLVGPTATGIGDMAITPFQTEETNPFPGVEVHANFISNLLEGRFIRRGPRENLVDLGFLLLFSLAAGLLLSVVPPARATAVLVISLAAFWGVAYYLFAAHHTWIAAFLPTATLGVNYAGIVSYRFFFEERERKRVRETFGQYVAPGIVNQLLDRPELLRLGGEEKELTAMFSDIRNFTGISEKLSPRGLVELLNEHLSEMTEIVFQNRGTLDKYIGDSIMAFWGAPYPQPDHPENACKAGLAMLRALEGLQTRWQAAGKPRIDIGIGISTGPMLVGNMGSRRRFNFTIMGDNVNLASRLEGLNKTFGTRLIVSESTYEFVQDKMLTRELDLIRVKGKRRPVKIFELIGLRSESQGALPKVDRFHAALEAYRSAQWETAIGMFGELLRDFPDDGPTRVFVQRCWDLIENPPEGEWDGVFVMETK